MIRRSSRWKAISPSGFLLVLMCFGLPFLTLSCELPPKTIHVDMTGWDMAFGGVPTVTTTGDAAGKETPSADESIAVQPLVLISFAVAAAGIALAWLSRWVGIAFGVAAAVLLMIGQGRVRDYFLTELQKQTELPLVGLPESIFTYRFGYWTCLALLFGIAAYNIAELVLSRRTPPPELPPDQPASSSK